MTEDLLLNLPPGSLGSGIPTSLVISLAAARLIAYAGEVPANILTYPLAANLVSEILGGSDSIVPTTELSVGAQNTAGVVACTVTFSKPVIGFVVGDIIVTNGLAGTFVAVSESVYTFNVTPTISDTVSIQIPAACCTDVVGNNNTASTLEEYDALIWLLLDRFSTDLTAGNVNGSLSDSGHTRTVVDTASHASITGGELLFNGGETVHGNPGIFYPALTRQAGQLLLAKIKTDSIRITIGFGTTQSGQPQAVSLYLGTGQGLYIFPGGSQYILQYALNTFYDVAIVLRSTGAFYLVKIGTDWCLLSIGRTGSGATLYPGVSGYTAVANSDNVRAILLDPTNPTLFPTPTLSDTFAVPTIADASGNGRVGAAVNVGLDGAEGIGDGNTAASWKASNAGINVYSASFAGAFNGAAGTIVFWAKVDAAAIWTDGIQHYLVKFLVDIDNYIIISKSTTNNRVALNYKAGGTEKSGIISGLSSTDWMCFAFTWDKAADETRAYYNGSQQGATLTGLGTWAGSPVSNYVLLGIGGASWQGVLAHCAVWDKALTPAEIAAIYAATATQQATVLATQSANLIAYWPLNEQYQSDGLAHVEGGAGDGLTWDANANNWYAAANKLYIVPQLGAELLTNPDFSAWTGDDPDGWAVSGEVGSDPMVTEVDPSGGAGTGAARFLSTAINSAPQITPNPNNKQTAGLWYQASLTISSRVGGSLRFVDWLSGWTTGAAQASIQVTGRAKHAQVLITTGTAPTNITLNSASLKNLPFADCLRVASPADSDEPYQSIDMTIDPNTQAGGVINLDSMSNPQNGIHWWINLSDNRAYVREMVAGTWQADAVAGVAVTYSAGGRGEIRRIGNSVYLFYAGTYVASFTTVVSSANTKQALFLTSAGSYLQNVTVFPTNSLDLSLYA